MNEHGCISVKLCLKKKTGPELFYWLLLFLWMSNTCLCLLSVCCFLIYLSFAVFLFIFGCAGSSLCWRAFSSCSALGCSLCIPWSVGCSWCRAQTFSCPRRVESSKTRDQTHDPCIGPHFLIHCTTRDVLLFSCCDMFLNCEASLKVWETALEYVRIVFPLLQSLLLCDFLTTQTFKNYSLYKSS